MTLIELLTVTLCVFAGTLVARELAAYNMLVRIGGFLVGTIGSMLIIYGVFYVYGRRPTK
jgi:hypothetical protein